MEHYAIRYNRISNQPEEVSHLVFNNETFWLGYHRPNNSQSVIRAKLRCSKDKIKTYTSTNNWGNGNSGQVQLRISRGIQSRLANSAVSGWVLGIGLYPELYNIETSISMHNLKVECVLKVDIEYVINGGKIDMVLNNGDSINISEKLPHMMVLCDKQAELIDLGISNIALIITTKRWGLLSSKSNKTQLCLAIIDKEDSSENNRGFTPTDRFNIGKYILEVIKAAQQ